jgi:hypothetical protein
LPCPVTGKELKAARRAEISTVQISAVGEFFKLPGCSGGIFKPGIAAVYKAEDQGPGGTI